MHRRNLPRSAAALTLIAALAGCRDRAKAETSPGNSASAASAPASAEPSESASEQPGPYDPLAEARAQLGKLDNLEATIPPACYTATEGHANPCYVCHTRSTWPNAMDDWDLQGSYDFSDTAKHNYWTNLFEDRSEAAARISDAEIQAWIAEDNYSPLRETLASWDAQDYRGFRPDLDFDAGFDEAGFARDNSGWRAFRYKPFPGGFWPTNGSADDVLIRLPPAFRQTAAGEDSNAIYAINLEILSASLGAAPALTDDELCWPTAPIDETLAGLDLDGDGELEAELTRIVGLPETFVGAAASVPVRRGLYPEGTEFLHSVRYLDPDGGPATRMKELRYSRRIKTLSDHDIQRRYRQEAEEKAEGGLPRFGGSPLLGLRNAFGWLLQGFIEDQHGRLRVQTEEETYFCMGCHSNLSVTADQSFAFPRKLPGAAGWAYQALAGIPDVPSIEPGRAPPLDDPDALGPGEIETYLERAAAGDPFRTNAEMLDRWFEQGKPNAEAIAAADDIVALLAPSPARALALDKAYLAIVRAQSFTRGREPTTTPLTTVHQTIREPSTGLSEAERVYLDYSLRLAWPALAEICGDGT